MTRVVAGEDCGNSPKNKFAQELTIALAKGDARFVLGHVTDDIRWTLVGDRVLQGKDALARTLERNKNDSPAELVILHVVTHGKAGAVNGTTRSKGGQTRAFCAVYDFTGAQGTRVQAITYYMIETT